MRGERWALDILDSGAIDSDALEHMLLFVDAAERGKLDKIPDTLQFLSTSFSGILDEVSECTKKDRRAILNDNLKITANKAGRKKADSISDTSKQRAFDHSSLGKTQEQVAEKHNIGDRAVRRNVRQSRAKDDEPSERVRRIYDRLTAPDI